MKCYQCKGERFERRTVEIPTRVGSHTVVDRSVALPVCSECGEFTVPAKKLQTAELRAIVVAFTDAPEVTGAMLRSARKALDLTQGELAARIGASAESVSRWERSERPMEPWVPLAVLNLVREQIMPRPPHVELRRAG